MTVTAQSSDGVLHQFPDGTPPAVVDKAMRDYANTPDPAPTGTVGGLVAKSIGARNPNANTAVDVARVIPGGLAQGVAGIMGIPGDLQSLGERGVRYLANKVGIPDSVLDAKIPGTHPAHLPTSADYNNLFSKPTGGYYQPQTTAGDYAQTIFSLAPAAFGGEASLPTRILGRVIAPAVVGQAAGDIPGIKGTDAEPYFKAGGAIVTALAAHNARPVIRSLNRLATATTGSGFLDPSIEAQAQLRTALAKDGGEPAAQAKLNSYANSGASNPALIDVGGNNTMRLVRAAAAPEGAGQNTAISYADRIRANLQDRASSRTMQLAPDQRNATQLSADLEKQQGDLAQTQYKAPYAQPAAVTPELASALQGTPGRTAITRALTAATARRDVQQMAELQDLKQVAAQQGGGQDPLMGKFRTVEDALGNLSAGSLDRVRIAMRETGSSLARGGSKDIASGYKGRVSDIDTALDQTPGLADARAGYRGMQAQRDAVPVGQAALATPSSDYAGQIAALAKTDPRAVATAAIGHRQALLDAIERPAAGQTGILNRVASSDQQGANLATSFGAKNAASYQEAITNEVSRLRNANAISPNTGSQTALRQGDAALVDLPQIPRSATGFVLALVNKIRAGAAMTPAERAEIVRLGVSEANLKALALKTAAPPNLPHLLAPGVLSLSHNNRPTP